MLILAILVVILWIGSVPSSSAAIFSTGYIAVCHGSFDGVPADLSLGPVALAPVELHDADDDPIRVPRIRFGRNMRRFLQQPILEGVLPFLQVVTDVRGPLHMSVSKCEVLAYLPQSRHQSVLPSKRKTIHKDCPRIFLISPSMYAPVTS